MTEEKDLSTAGSRLKRLVYNPYSIALVTGILLMMLQPFVNLTFSAKSWESFGAANAAGTPGSYLSPDAVYKLPVNERFRVDGGLLLSVRRDSLKRPAAALTAGNGRVRATDLSVANALSAEGACTQVAVHLMRTPADGDTEFFIMYTSARLKKEECRGFWARWFGGA